MAAPIVISILANASQANATLGKTSGVMGKIGKAGKIMGAGVAVGVLALGAGAVDAGKSLIRIEQINAQTESAIKATGGAARVSASHIEKMTGALEASTSTEAETIQQGANLLLTFKKVGNQAGKNNKIFDRAVKSSVDLSRSGFGSVESASLLMGKALNDPIKGISALGRSGVTFTKQQKDQIKTLVESGKTLDAQKIILKEVEGQVGGAGEAFRKTTAGKIEQFQHQLGTLGETILSGLMPGLTKMMDFLLDTVVPGVANLGPKFTAAIAGIKAFFTGLGSSGGEAGSRFQEFRTTIADVMANVQGIFTSYLSILTSLWSRFGSDIIGFATATFSNLMTYLRGAFTLISGIFKTVAALLKGDWRGAWEGIKQILRGALTVLKALVSQGVNTIKTLFSVGLKALTSIVSGIFGGLKSAASKGVSALVRFVESIPGKIKSAFGNAKTMLTGIGGNIVDGLKGGIEGAWHKVLDFVDAGIKKIPKKIRQLMGIASPSRVTRRLGQYISQGLGLGITLGTSTVINAVRRQGVNTRKEYLKQAKDVTKGLRAASGARVKALVAQSREYASNVASSARQFASLGSLQLGENENLSAAKIKQHLTDRLAAIRNFTTKMRTLSKRGLSSDLLDQIAGMGVEQGTAYADALAKASPAALREINGLQSKVGGASNTLGKTTANALYKNGVNAAKGFHDGLVSYLKKIDGAGVKMSKALVRSLKRALGIKSPSRVLRGLGAQSVDGLNIGLDARRVKDQGKALSRALVTGYASPQLDATLRAGFEAMAADSKPVKATGDTYNITVRLDASMTTEQMGVAYHRAIEAAKELGMVKK